MSRFILPAVLFAAVAGAQTTPAAPVAATSAGQPAAAAPGSALAAGAIIPAELSKSLDAKKMKVGDKVEVRSAVDLLAHGQIVLPRNTKIVGHVTEAKMRSKDSQESEVGITFDHILFKDGHQLPIQVAVQAIGRPLQSLPPGYEAMGDNPASLSPVAPPGADGTMGGPSGPGGMGPQSYPGTRTGAQDGSLSGNPSSNPASGTTIAPLGPTSQGAVGLKGISLTNSGPAALISSSTQNVHLDSGSQLILKTQ
jgi:hypothetical protein